MMYLGKNFLLEFTHSCLKIEYLYYNCLSMFWGFCQSGSLRNISKTEGNVNCHGFDTELIILVL